MRWAMRQEMTNAWPILRRQNNCMKRHIKPCRHGGNYKKEEKCLYKHKLDSKSVIKIDQICNLEKIVKELLDHLKRSEASIDNKI